MSVWVYLKNKNCYFHPLKSKSKRKHQTLKNSKPMRCWEKAYAPTQGITKVWLEVPHLLPSRPLSGRCTFKRDFLMRQSSDCSFLETTYINNKLCWRTADRQYSPCVCDMNQLWGLTIARAFPAGMQISDKHRGNLLPTHLHKHSSGPRSPEKDSCLQNQGCFLNYHCPGRKKSKFFSKHHHLLKATKEASWFQADQQGLEHL